MQTITDFWKTTTGKLIIIGGSGFIGIIFLCFVCMICGALGNNKNNIEQLPPKSTTVKKVVSIATETHTPANTPIPTNTPVPTKTPIPELLFTDIIQGPKEKGWTDTQYSTYFDTIKGKEINGWSGTILEIKEYAGDPYVSLDMKPGDPKIDAYVYINKDDVLKVALEQNITFAGTIDSNWSEGNNLYALQIKNVILTKLGEIPTPTSIPPTPTLGPTAPPTPDIGNEIEAGGMCKDFVRKNLKSPSTADFGGWLEKRDKAVFVPTEKINDLGLKIDISKLHNSGIWAVAGQVDAQNSFGAMIRSEYICVMDYDKNTKMWYLLDISIK